MSDTPTLSDLEARIAAMRELYSDYQQGTVTAHQIDLGLCRTVAMLLYDLMLIQRRLDLSSCEVRALWAEWDAIEADMKGQTE